MGKRPEGQEKPFKNPTPKRPEDPNVEYPGKNDRDDHLGGISTS